MAPPPHRTVVAIRLLPPRVGGGGVIVPVRPGVQLLDLMSMPVAFDTLDQFLADVETACAELHVPRSIGMETMTQQHWWCQQLCGENGENGA